MEHRACFDQLNTILGDSLATVEHRALKYAYSFKTLKALKSVMRFLLVFLLLFILSFFFRGWLYRQSFTYKAIEERPTYEPTSPQLIEMIEESSDKPVLCPWKLEKPGTSDFKEMVIR